MFAANMLLRAQLAEFDASIAELNSRLWVLERARWPIKRQLDRVVYPILTVPPEIMSEIFLRCLPPAPVESKVDQPSPHPGLAPLLLLRVCRTWKEIALSTPHLWDSLHLSDSTLPSPNTMTKVVTGWFGRAGSSPLTLSLRTQWSLGADAIGTILSPLAPRLKKLWLKLDRVDDLANFGPFPILEILKISRHMYDPESPLKLFSVAPRLHRLICTKNAKPSTFILPQAMSELTFSASISIDELENLLRDAPFLKKVSCLVYSSSRSNTFMIIHNHLETLHSNLHPDLGLLRLPALQTLHLSNYAYDALADDLIAFLSSSIHLRHFRADLRLMSMSVAWFAAMPGLTDIDLYNPKQPFLSEFFARLDHTTDSGFLPCLRTLTFRNCAFELDASILQALSSRRAATENTAMLESFQQFRPQSVFLRATAASIRGSLEDATVYASRELIERGMSVRIGLFERNTDK